MLLYPSQKCFHEDSINHAQMIKDLQVNIKCWIRIEREVP